MDPIRLFKIRCIIALPTLSIAFLEWPAEEDGSFRLIEELNLKQLGIEVIRTRNTDPGRGGLHFRGNLQEGLYFKD
jgi:hypothetical protein